MTVYGIDLSNHNGSIDWDKLYALGDVHLVTHKLTEGIGWTDPFAAGRSTQISRAAAAGWYFVLWPTNSQDNPQNQAKWFVDEIERLASWMFAHPCPVAQGDFELFGNFVPYRAPTPDECNSAMNWVRYYWRQRTQNPLYCPDYAPYWLYGDALAKFNGDLWASSYVGISGGYKALYPGDGDRRWTQVPSKPARILQYTSTGTFGTAAAGVDANAVRRVSTAADLQALFLGKGDILMALTDSEQNELLAAARHINKTIGAGQTSFEGTVAAILSTVQVLVNEGRSQSSSILASVGAAKDAVLGYLAAHPATADLTDADKQAIVDGVVAAFAGHPVDVNPGPILDALNARLAA